MTLLVDVFTLAEAGERDTPTELLPTICREIDAPGSKAGQFVVRGRKKKN